jgi:hypothetical protein
MPLLEELLVACPKNLAPSEISGGNLAPSGEFDVVMMENLSPSKE